MPAWQARPPGPDPLPAEGKSRLLGPRPPFGLQWIVSERVPDQEPREDFHSRHGHPDLTTPPPPQMGNRVVTWPATRCDGYHILSLSGWSASPTRIAPPQAPL